MLRLTFFVLLLSVLNLGFSQCDSNDLLQEISDQEKTIVQDYLKDVNVGSTLNRGTLEIKNYPEDEHPYYLKNEWTKGSLTYDGIFYPEVSLKYNIENNVLITKNSLGVAYGLRGDKVKNFKLFDRVFVNHNYGKLGDPQILQVQYCGPVSLFLKSTKKYKEIQEYPRVRITYEEEQTHLLYKEGTFHKLVGRKSILKPFEDQKKAIKTFIKEENLMSLEMRDEFFSKITAHYNSLIERQ